jgi:peroxiredoxin family protein/TusA-related sulfurtransferase
MFKAIPVSMGPSSPCGKSAAPHAVGTSAESNVHIVDACGLQCPGPILQLKSALEEMAPGETLCIRASDPGFLADAPAWCHSTGHELIKTASAGKGVYEAWIRKTAGNLSASQVRSAGEKAQTIVVFSGDLDKVMAAFIIANGAASMGAKVTLFFTFWGLNALRRKNPPAVRKTLIEKMFGWMMPRGAGKLALSKMDMFGVGRAMMKGIMKKKHVATLDALIDSAKLNGIRLVACAMSMDVMGIHKEELIDGVEIGGVAMYLDEAQAGNVNLFI